MKRKIIIALIIVILCFVVYKLFIKKEKLVQASYMPVTVALSDVKEIINTTGEVSALNRVEIKPSVAGRVDTLVVNEGDKVRKGQILAYLSSSDRVAILDAVRANEKENLSDWESTYKPTPVISPMNGKIILRNVVEGQTIATSDVLFALADELIVEASVDEADIGKVKVGQRAVISLDAYKDISVGGNVFQILEEGQNVSNVITYYVKIRPDETPKFFKSLMTANIEITVKDKKNVVVIPWNSVNETQEGKSYVLVGDNLIQNTKEIVTGIVDGDNVEVVSGLNDGDTILVKADKYQLENTTESTKGFLQMTPQKRKSNSEILAGSETTKTKK
ncbi:MAG: efflux RND transporter periplasmic adaptor subunit [Endomicrobiaceae bacterium]|nr:efflux RND transporter periplasmic adaptor subunit [Endomicrobiaceae bacterium]